jgi:hypothetical protein
MTGCYCFRRLESLSVPQIFVVETELMPLQKRQVFLARLRSDRHALSVHGEGSPSSSSAKQVLKKAALARRAEPSTRVFASRLSSAGMMRFRSHHGAQGGDIRLARSPVLHCTIM